MRTREQIKAELTEILVSLSEEERRIMSLVVRKEAESLHLKAPHLKDDIVKIVKQVITK